MITNNPWSSRTFDEDHHARLRHGGRLLLSDEMPQEMVTTEFDHLEYMKRIVMIDHGRTQINVANRQNCSHDPRDYPIKPEFANLPTPPVSPLQLPPALLDQPDESAAVE